MYASNARANREKRESYHTPTFFTLRGCKFGAYLLRVAWLEVGFRDINSHDKVITEWCQKAIFPPISYVIAPGSPS